MNMTTIHALRGLMSRPLFTRSFAFMFGVAALLASAPGGVNAAVITVDTAKAANWKQSTFSYIDNTDPNWPGVTTPLPNAATYTVDTANQALAAGFTGIFAGSGVTFYRSVFSLPSFSTLTADLSALVDNNIEIFVNGISLARYVTDLNGFLSGDFRLFIGTSGAVNNGYLGGRPFSFVQTPFPQSAWVSGGNNEVVVAVRNLGDGDTGGFRLSLGLTTAPAVATVTLGNLAHTFDGTPRSASATTTPSGLNVQITYDGSTTPPSAAGTYAVLATIINEVNYTGSASGTLSIVASSASPPVVIGADGSVSGSGPLNLDGGTLQASASAIVTKPIVLGPTGGSINTLLHTLTMGGVISGPGQLVKQGPGVLALAADNTYSGGT